MTVTFYGNYLNHHIINICDEMFSLLGEDFKFVCTCRSNPSLMKGGLDYCHLRSYCINPWEHEDDRLKAYNLAINSEVCRFGGDSLQYAILRAENNPKGLSFEEGERWLKKGFINIFSPNLIKWLIAYYKWFKNANFYYLCSSAFCAQDLRHLGAYKNRCFKWGYFTEVNEDNIFDVNELKEGETEKISIMWCARFIGWKHPELPIRMAEKLKLKGFNFVVDMYGSGVKLDKMKRLAKQLNVLDVVNFKGNKPNNHILLEMKKHDIFLFTSDRNEGWGAVLNEALSNGCAVVASNTIGSVPFLITEGQNGLCFDSNNLDSLCEKVLFFIENPIERHRIANNAITTMREVWSPRLATKSLLTLIDNLQSGQESSLLDGPCSKA